jgi:hypothetical protein
MFKLPRLFTLSLCLGIFAMITPAMYSTLAAPQGTSLLYGKVADTRNWQGITGDSLVSNAKITINTKPQQVTYTDAQGQFWFRKLRDISYGITIEAPNQTEISFVKTVEGDTSHFFDLAAEEKQNLEAIAY